MFAATLLRQQPAMQPEASAAENDEASDDDLPPGGRRAKRFQYGTGDKPLAGYTIKRGVGRGGFGEVYFATSDAGKEVALKLIRRNLDIELRGVRQCLNLKHPNLVALYDLRSDDADDQWVVMEFVSGESLEQALERHPEGMPIEDAIGWLRGIAAGVGYLHSSGIVHRDLKPGNIYIERGSEPIEQRVKIGDYGLSKFISTSRRSGQTESVGTVHYMAPEIAGGRYGREIDTYALGVILYEMLTGHVPFEGESVGEVLMKHLTAEPDLKRLEDPYRSIVAGALAKDPETRISSVDQLLAMLPGVAPNEATSDAEPLKPAIAEVWSPVSRPPHTDHPVPPREPLWQGLVELTDNLRTNWRTWNAPPLGKGLVLFGVIALLIVSSGVWIGVLVPTLLLYGLYYVIWAAFLQGATSPPTPTASSLAQTEIHQHKPTRPRRPHFNWRAAALRQRRARSTREKAATLTGSMFGSAIVSILAGVIAGPLLADGTQVDPTAMSIWFSTVATVGCWGVLLSSAAAEAHFEDRLPRRGMNLLAGIAVGAVAYGLMEQLGGMLPISTLDFVPPPYEVLLEEAADIDLYHGAAKGKLAIAVPLAASMAYFGALFLLVRWWRPTDYIRRNRIGLWSIAGTLIAAWLVSIVTYYPQPLGLALAGVIAATVQVSSPWCPPSRRAALARSRNSGGIYDA